MKTSSRTNTIMLALAGCLFLAGYFWLFRNSQFIHLLKLQVPQQQILAQADQRFKDSPLGEYNLSQTIEVALDEKPLRFLQEYRPQDSSENLVSPGRLKISRNGSISSNGDEKNVSIAFYYDFAGHYRGFEAGYADLPDSNDLSISAAIQKAAVFLSDQGIDTATTTLIEKNSKRANGLQEYEFTFTAPTEFSDSLQMNYKLELRGSTITSFTSQLSLNEDNFKFSKAGNVADIVFDVATGVVWLILVIFLIVVFIQRLRHDEIEFKKGLWLGIALTVIMWLSVGFASYPDWAGVLVGGGFAAVFSGAGMLVAVAVTESYTRELWPEKIVLLDLLFQGRIRVVELGSAMLNSIFIAGASVFIFGFIVWLSSQLNFGYISMEAGTLWVYRNTVGRFSIPLSNLIQSLYIAFAFIVCLAVYLRSKFHSRLWFIVILAILINLAGLHELFLQPSYLTFFVFYPIALLWAYWVFQYDIVTIFLSLLAGYTFLDLSVLNLLPEGFLNPWGLFTIVLILGYLLIGIVLLFSRKKLEDFENYVPEYVSRIAERERLLRELEIARNIQTDFLPREIPAFPGLDIAGICRPAMEVGGDYYDFILDSEQNFRVIVGDVSGKGVSAAFYMTMTKGIIKTLSKWLREPSKLLSEMNVVFYENSPRNIFISIVYGIFNLQDKTLTFACAGHNPLLVRKRQKAAMEFLNPEGIAIGMEKGPLFASIIKDQCISIEPGDIFIFYTDGISEARNNRGEEFGEDRLSALIEENSRSSAQEILECINNAVFEFSGHVPQHDDFTMVIVKVTEP